MSGAEQTAEEVRSQIQETITSRLESQEPSEEEKEHLETEHRGHLVRDTTSTLSIEPEKLPPGVESKATVPDTFCFTCNEWIGFSGVDLRGKPRSKEDAYYLGGVPEDVRAAREYIGDSLADLLTFALNRVEHVESVEDATEFVEEQLERTGFVQGDVQ